MRAFYFAAVGLLAAASVARAGCEDLQNLSLPLSGDTTLELSSAAIDCAILEDDLLEEFIIEGGTLTLTGPSTTKFTNLKFTVMDGAGLIFDFDMTEFGPNFGYFTVMDGAGLIFDFDMTEFGPNFGYTKKDDYGGYMVQVMSGGSVEFTGELTATGLRNMRSVFGNEDDGSIEFASNAVFSDCDSNVFRDNYGRLRFYGDVTFTDNIYIAIGNFGGTVRIDGDALFVRNGRSFEGHSGGAFANESKGTAIFQGLATFSENLCDFSGGGVYNGPGSTMTFYKKASFYDNRCREGDGGGVVNRGGDLKFRGSVVASGNTADRTGGGIATGNGGTTTFYGWTTIQSNSAYENGGGMSLYNRGNSADGNVVTFKNSNKIRISDNESDRGCNNIYVEETSKLIGYDTTSDICDQS